VTGFSNGLPYQLFAKCTIVTKNVKRLRGITWGEPRDYIDRLNYTGANEKRSLSKSRRRKKSLKLSCASEKRKNESLSCK